MKSTAKAILICLGALLCISFVFVLALEVSNSIICTTHCPKEDIIILIATPFGMTMGEMEKGTLNEENRGELWISREGFDEALEQEAPELEAPEEGIKL